MSNCDARSVKFNNRVLNENHIITCIIRCNNGWTNSIFNSKFVLKSKDLLLWKLVCKSNMQKDQQRTGFTALNLRCFLKYLFLFIKGAKLNSSRVGWWNQNFLREKLFSKSNSKIISSQEAKSCKLFAETSTSVNTSLIAMLLNNSSKLASERLKK